MVKCNNIIFQLANISVCDLNFHCQFLPWGYLSLMLHHLFLREASALPEPRDRIRNHFTTMIAGCCPSGLNTRCPREASICARLKYSEFLNWNKTWFLLVRRLRSMPQPESWMSFCGHPSTRPRYLPDASFGTCRAPCLPWQAKRGSENLISGVLVRSRNPEVVWWNGHDMYYMAYIYIYIN